MKTDVETSPTFDDFLEALAEPAALCAPDLSIHAANAAFRALATAELVRGTPLESVFPGIASLVPEDGRAVELSLPHRTRNTLIVRLSRRGRVLAVTVPAMSTRHIEHLANDAKVLLELSRDVAGAASEEQLVAAVAAGVKRLLPALSFCVRVVDPRTGALTTLYAEGRLADGAREKVVLRRTSLQRANVKLSAIPPGTVEITDGTVPLLFRGTAKGICAPLVASGQLFGALNFEYPHDAASDLESDERLLVQIANHAAVGIRNAKLIDELTFVRTYLEELLENANALIVVTNKERGVLVFNKAFAALTGLSKDDVLGRDFLELVPKAEAPRVLGALSDSLRGERVNFEAQVRAPGGREVRVALATSCVLSPQGEIEGLIAIGQDLTALRDMEARVVQAEKLSSLGKLAASVAHEINNPMTAVAAYAESLLDRAQANLPPPPDEPEKLRKIVENTQRILRFTYDLVSYARPASDKAQEFQLHPTLDMAVSFCGHVLEQQGVKVVKDYGDLPPLLGVPAHMVQVFVNLITNACHAMMDGGTVRLSTRLEEGRATIRVADDGAGIPEELHAKIFEPFFTTKPAGRGTGLGLSIVQGIVEKHGGHIDVRSLPGQGSVFTVRLPLPG